VADSVDVVVVGMGPAGEEVAGSLAERGLDVVGVESSGSPNARDLYSRRQHADTEVGAGLDSQGG
jgi:flavin-dependent dehydrogenase